MKSIAPLLFAALYAFHAEAGPMVSRVNPGKKGAVYTNAADVRPLGTAVSWAYDWASQPGGTLPTGVEYVPMLRTARTTDTQNWNANAEAALAGGATHILGFNEPDSAAQANLSPNEAAAAWKAWIQPFADRATLVSPAITNGNSGIPWMQDFLAACPDCKVDVIAIHVYDSATDVDAFKSYITAVAQKFGKPVWVTEFAGLPGSEQEQIDLINDIVPFLDGESSVERYAYFADVDGILVANGNLTPLGSAYVAR